MKSKIRKKKSTLIILLITLTLVFSSCLSMQNEINKALLEITPPDPIVNGISAIKYENGEIIMSEKYYFDLVEYIIEIEEYKKLLEE